MTADQPARRMGTLALAVSAVPVLAFALTAGVWLPKPVGAYVQLLAPLTILGAAVTWATARSWRAIRTQRQAHHRHQEREARFVRTLTGPQ